MFGIVDGPEAEPAIGILNAEGVGLLSSRKLHPTQRFTKLRAKVKQALAAARRHDRC